MDTPQKLKLLHDIYGHHSRMEYIKNNPSDTLKQIQFLNKEADKFIQNIKSSRKSKTRTYANFRKKILGVAGGDAWCMFSIFSFKDMY